MTAPCAIYWFRNDLRLHDNPSLLRAIDASATLVCVYCHETPAVSGPWGFERLGPHRRRFLAQGLSSLRAALEAVGQVLVECAGDPGVALKAIAESLGTDLIFSEAIEAPEEIESIRDLRARGLTVHTTWQSSLLDPLALPFDVDRLPDVFTEFRQRIEGEGVRPPAALPSPTRWPAAPAGCLPQSRDFPLPEAFHERGPSFPYREPPFAGGEKNALLHLSQYLERRLPDTYKQTRNALSGVDFSSKFSPWLAQGSLSARWIFERLAGYEARVGANEGTYWLWFELLWRDYFRFLHFKYGKRLYRPEGLGQSPPTGHDAVAFKAWCQGKTGHPLIDAGMRELFLTGYLSNRMRQIVASYLVHDLTCDWRSGAAWFESQLIDYDVYSNQGNWLYIAGLGTDPRGGRRFNPDKQAKTYDPDGAYSAYWLNATLGEPESPPGSGRRPSPALTPDRA